MSGDDDDGRCERFSSCGCNVLRTPIRVVLKSIIMFVCLCVCVLTGAKGRHRSATSRDRNQPSSWIHDDTSAVLDVAPVAVNMVWKWVSTMHVM